MIITHAMRHWSAEKHAGIYLLAASGHPGYVGQTKRTFAKRWLEHLTLLSSGVHPNPSLQRTFVAVKASGLHAAILQVAPPQLRGDDLIAWLFAWEQYYIARLGAANQMRRKG